MKYFAVILLVSVLFGCNNSDRGGDTKDSSNDTTQAVKPVNTVDFNADSAYNHVKNQVAFGPRIPGTKEHLECYNYILDNVSKYADTVYTQNTRILTYDKTNIPLKNIIAEFNPAAAKRIILCAHWDTRPFADEDQVDPKKPFDGANDGASGVGVLLEIASKIKALNRKDLGVDLIFFDAEDWGDNTGQVENSYCLGSQYWASKLHRENYKADFGILLDMVGAPGALFGYDGYSAQVGPQYMSLIWETAKKAGYGDYFKSFERGFITDDHLYMHRGTGIPVIDIIDTDPSTRSRFGKYWHTHADNMNAIDRNTLKAVGQTLIEVLAVY
ncbi:MAG TPA: M28 family peptidase [Bacteroidia bacterium]